MLARLDGSCRTPIAALATLDGQGRMELQGLIAKPDGSEVVSDREAGRIGDAIEIGTELGARLAGRAGPGFLEPA